MDAEVLKLVLENLTPILATLATVLGSVVAATWWLAKHLYSRQIEILEKEKNYLQRQIQDKDTYARGIMSVMGQRLELAQQEPIRLQQLIDEKEEKLDFLQRENERLLTLGGNENSSEDLVDTVTKLAKGNLRQTLIFFLDDLDTVLPKQKELYYLRTNLRHHEQSTVGKDIDYHFVISSLLRHTIVQAQDSISLEIGLGRSLQDLRKSQLWNHQKINELFTPLLDGTKPIAEFDPFLEDYEVKSIEFYLERKRDSEEDQENP